MSGGILDQRILKKSLERQAAIATATRAMGWMFGAGWLICIVICAFLAQDDLSLAINRFGLLFGGAWFASPIIVVLGEWIGWLACRIVGDSTIPVTRFACVLALVASLGAVGWLVVMTQMRI